MSFDIDPRKKQNFVLEATPFHVGLVAVLRRAFRLFMDLKIEGLENFPREGAVIIAASETFIVNIILHNYAILAPVCCYVLGLR